MSAELAITTSLIGVSAMLMWVSLKYNESEDLWVGMISHIFHGFSIVLWLPILYTGFQFATALPGSAALESVLGPVIAIMGLLLFVYAMFMIMRSVFGIINAGYQSARRLMSGESDRESEITREGRF